MDQSIRAIMQLLILGLLSLILLSGCISEEGTGTMSYAGLLLQDAEYAEIVYVL